MAVHIPASFKGRIVSFYCTRQFTSIYRKVIKWVFSFQCLPAGPVFKMVDVYSDYTFTIIPSFFNLVSDPFSFRRPVADENNDTRSAVHLAVNPFSYRGVTTSDDDLPIIVSDWRITLDNTHIANLTGPPIVRFVMETEKSSPQHTPPFQKLKVIRFGDQVLDCSALPVVRQGFSVCRPDFVCSWILCICNSESVHSLFIIAYCYMLDPARSKKVYLETRS